MNTSTHSQDVQRGLAHPASIAARSQRIEIAHSHKAAANTEFEHALWVIRSQLKTGEQLAQLLNVASAAVLAVHGPSSYLYDFVSKLDELATKIVVEVEKKLAGIGGK